MAIPNLNFEPETVALMGHVCDEAWSKLQASATRPTPAQEQALRSDLAQRVMAAVVDGERDPVQLLRKALNGAGWDWLPYHGVGNRPPG